ncbi:hypothetical protein NDU88_003912 [Pleurodeles waltl]|uniref:Uncharacterized protein n=1 Tax=Pleurodeles waltl TaxID=8319 RepID=A0AAV7RGJ0_PLEWA|nr:hypothetical protein NDU88_003912 [Pleurodeles waltl]
MSKAGRVESSRTEAREKIPGQHPRPEEHRQDQLVSGGAQIHMDAESTLETRGMREHQQKVEDLREGESGAQSKRRKGDIGKATTAQTRVAASSE